MRGKSWGVRGCGGCGGGNAFEDAGEGANRCEWAREQAGTSERACVASEWGARGGKGVSREWDASQRACVASGWVAREGVCLVLSSDARGGVVSLVVCLVLSSDARGGVGADGGAGRGSVV